VGGNLTLVAGSLGAPGELDPRDAILLLEEVGEPPYRIDRMLRQLCAAGILPRLAGVGVGELTGCEDARHPDPSALEVIEEAVRPLGVPLVVGLPFGHSRSNLAWPLGARATIDADRGEVRILERGVVRAT
jgi:muramoyltetrapeptide carboxypeptidase